jgi:hypothetical protein
VSQSRYPLPPRQPPLIVFWDKYKAAASSIKKNNVPFVGLTMAAGNLLSLFSSISLKTVALLLPVIKKITFSALLITEKVKVILSFLRYIRW